MSRAPTVVILHKGKTRPRKPLREILKTSDRDSPARIFPIARWERGVPLSDKLRFVRQRSSLCEAVAFSRVERLSNLKLWIPTKKEDNIPKHRVISILSGSMKSRISASTSCFVRPDWSITAAGLSSNASLPRSSSSSRTPPRRPRLNKNNGSYKSFAARIPGDNPLPSI